MSPRKQPPAKPSPGALLRPRDAANLLAVDPATLADWCSDGKHGVLGEAVITLPSGHRRYRKDVIDAYLRDLAKGAA